MLNTITFLGMHINMQTLWGYLVVYTYEFKTRCSRKISEPLTPNNWTCMLFLPEEKSSEIKLCLSKCVTNIPAWKRAFCFAYFFPLRRLLSPRRRCHQRRPSRHGAVAMRGGGALSPAPAPARHRARLPGLKTAGCRWLGLGGPSSRGGHRPEPRDSSLSELFPLSPPPKGGRGSPRLAGAPWRGVVAAALTVPTSEEKAAFSPCFSCARGV